MPRITRVATRALSIPLHTPFVTALRRTSEVTTLVVTVETDDERGYGEAPQVWAVTGESIASAQACVEQVLAPVLTGADSDDWADLATRVERSCARNGGAKAAVQTALLDLVSRGARRPLASLLAEQAGRPAPHSMSLPTDVTVSAGEPADLAETAGRRAQEGFTHLKLKVGTDAATDVARVRAVREAVGPALRIRLDANQGWSPQEAVEVIAALARADLDVELVEQPVRGEDVEGLAWVRERADLPVMADETVYDRWDLERVIRLGAADAVNIKLAKCGGPLQAVTLLQRAVDAGLGTMVGSMMESHIGVGAAASVVAAVGTSAVPDLDAAWWCAQSPFVGGPTYRPGLIDLPTEPGLGLSL